jgi:hypothetical protein
MGATRSTLDAIFQLRCAGRACTVNAAEDLFICFDTVADDAAIAMRANRRQRVDCAFEAIEGVTLSAHNDFKGLVVFVFADFAHRHTQLLRARGGSRWCLFTVATVFPVAKRAGHHRYRLQICALEILLVLNEAESYH